MTHSTDFARGLVGLLGQRAALGHAFHITSDEPAPFGGASPKVAGAPPSAVQP